MKRLREFCLLSLLLVLAGCGAASPWHEVKAFTGLYGLADLWVFGPDDVWVVGGTVQHFDGDDWTELDTGISADYTGVWGFAPDDLWLVGGTRLVHWNGSDFVKVDIESQGLYDAVAIWGQTPGDFWIAAGDGSAWHYDGVDLTRSSTPCSSASAIYGFSASDIWIQGTFGTCHFDGNGWQEVDIGIWGGEGDVFGLTPDDVWIVAESEEAAHWNGSDWQVYRNEDFFGELAALWAAASDDVWAAGMAGTIAHFDGAGWREVTHQSIGSPFLRAFTAVHGSSAENVWAVGYEMGASRNAALVYRYQGK